MSTHAFGDDQMRNYLAETLAGADSPLTVMPQDPRTRGTSDFTTRDSTRI